MKRYVKYAIGLIGLFCVVCSNPQKDGPSDARQAVDFVYPERRDFTEISLKGLPLVVTSHRGSSAFNLSPFQGDEADTIFLFSLSG